MFVSLDRIGSLSDRQYSHSLPAIGIGLVLIFCGCSERVTLVDGCTALNASEQNSAIADVVVEPGWLKAWEFTPSIAWSDQPELRYTHCKGNLYLRRGFANPAEAFSFKSEYIVFTDSVEIGRDALSPGACQSVAELGFDPNRRVAVRERRNIKWTPESPPRASLSSDTDMASLFYAPLHCSTEHFRRPDQLPTQPEIRYHVTLPRTTVRFRVNGEIIEPVEIAFPATSDRVMFVIRLSYPRSTDMSSLSDTIHVETPTGTYSLAVSASICPPTNRIAEASWWFALEAGKLVDQRRYSCSYYSD